MQTPVVFPRVRREVVMAAWSTVIVVSLVLLHHSRAASESELLSNFRRCQRVCNRVLSNTSLLGVVVGVGENLQNATATVGTGIRGGIQGVATGVRQGTAAVVDNVRRNIQVGLPPPGPRCYRLYLPLPSSLID